MFQRRTSFASGFLTVLLFVVGCDHDSSLGDVSGTVTLDGEPIKKGAIYFISPDGNSRMGAVIEDGQYTAKKVPVGAMKVTISSPKIVDKIKQENSPDRPYRLVTKEMAPAKYNEQSELTFEVKPGKNEKDFDLKSN